MANGFGIQIGLDDTDRTFPAPGLVLRLVIFEFDEDGYRAVHGTKRVGISVYRFRHHALESGRKTLQQEYDSAVKQHAAFASGDGEIPSHADARITIPSVAVIDLCHVSER